MWLNKLHRLEEYFIAFLLAAMTLVTFAQVLVRYVNSRFWTSELGNYWLETFTWLKPIASINMVWALELTTYLFAWLVLFGMSYGVRVGAHIGVDMVTKLLPPKGQTIFAILATLLCMAYCILLFIGAIQYVHLIYNLGIHSESLPVQQWIPYLILPVGLALLFFRFIQVMIKIVTGRAVNLLADEAQETLQEHLKKATETQSIKPN